MVFYYASTYAALLLLFIAVPAFSIEKGSYQLYSREDWSAQPPTSERRLDTPAPYVVIHHTYQDTQKVFFAKLSESPTYIPAACYTFEQCSKSMQSMQRYHMGLDWGDIGYNFCVGSEGSAYEGRGWHVVGVHAGRANNFSIGICLIGDWREDLPPPETLKTTKELISDGLALGIISLEYKLIGHQQAMATECPGQALLDEIKNWPHYQPGHINFTIPNIHL